MKTKNNLLKLSVALLMATTGFVNAQNPQINPARTWPSYSITTSGDIEATAIDTATINAVLPFRVSPDAYFVTNAALYNPSGFAWTWSGAALNNATGGALTVKEAGIYADTVVRATMPGTPGLDTLTIAEKSYPKSGSGCTDASPDSITVRIVAKPTMTLVSNDTIGGCAAQDYSFDVTFTGFAPYYVDYAIEAFNDLGASLGSVSYEAVILAGEEFLIDDTQIGVVGAVKYEIRINQIWDRIGFRSINRTDASVAQEDLASDSDDNLYIFAYPTPSTNSIRHLINNK